MKDVLALIFLLPFIAMAVGICALIITFVWRIIKDE